VLTNDWNELKQVATFRGPGGGKPFTQVIVQHLAAGTNRQLYINRIKKALSTLESKGGHVPTEYTTWKGPKGDTYAYLKGTEPIWVTPNFFNFKGKPTSWDKRREVVLHELGRYFHGFEAEDDNTGTTKDVFRWDKVFEYIDNKYYEIKKLNKKK
jgi:hypothetical protein